MTPSPAALIAETAALPLPSVVQITNVATGASMHLTIEERAPMGEDLLQLNAAAARKLGVAPDQPLLVRVRFVEPAIAYRQGAPLAYAIARRPKAHTEMAAAAPVRAGAVTADPLATAPAVASAEAPIITARLEPPRLPSITTEIARAPPAPPVAEKNHLAVAEQPAALRIQVGAYANVGNARRAVALVSAAGQPQMRTLQRADGVTLYRVFVDCHDGAKAAEVLKAKVVKIGFADARIVRPL